MHLVYHNSRYFSTATNQIPIKEFQIINLASAKIRRERFLSKPPPKPPIQRRRTAQTGARRKDNGLAIVDQQQGEFKDIAELNLTQVTVGDEIDGIKVIESDSRVEDLSALDYVEGDVGTEAHGMKIIENLEH